MDPRTDHDFGSVYAQEYLSCLEERRPELEGLLYRIGYSWQDAENAAQEAILEAVKLIKDHRVEELRDLSKWLRRVAVNRAHSNSRNHWRGWVSLPYDLVGATPYPDEEQVEAYASLWAAFERLPIHLQKLFAYCYIVGHTFAEAAEEFNLSLGVVSRHLRQARDRLRSDLSADSEFSARAAASVR